MLAISSGLLVEVRLCETRLPLERLEDQSSGLKFSGSSILSVIVEVNKGERNKYGEIFAYCWLSICKPI